MTPRTSAALLALAAAAALALAGCSAGPAASTSSDGSGTTTLRVASIDVDGSIPLMLADSEGFFAKHGLTVKRTLSPAFDGTLASVMNGQADIGFAASPPLLNALAKKAPVAVVAQTASTSERDAANVDVIDPSITRPRDLEGKTIGVTSLNDLGAVGVRLAVAKDGGDPAKLKIVELPSAQRLGALLEHRIDATTMLGPDAVTAKHTSGVRVLFQYTDGFPVGSPLDVYFASKTFIKANPDALKKFRAALNDAVEYANGHPDAVRTQLAELFKDIPDGATAAKEVQLTHYSTAISTSALDELEKGLTKYGNLAAITPAPDFYSYTAADK